MTDMLERYQQKVAGTNIDPRSLLSTDYFNHFNSVIMLFGMLPDAPELLDDIDGWEFLSYIDHFKTSCLDFGPLAIEAYEFAPSKLRDQFNRKAEEIRIFIEVSRLGLRRLIESGEKEKFADMALRVSRELQHMVDAGGSIVHGNENSMDQSAIDKMFNAWGEG
ncbi:MAG: hypothetical protein ABTQ34_06070 [Bdellovibrionales bacterium]